MIQRHIRYARSADGAGIAYLTAGAGTPLLFVTEPLFSNLELNWEFFASVEGWEEALTRIQWVQWSGRGTGLSDPGPVGTVAQWIEDLDAVLDAAAGGKATLLTVGSTFSLVAKYAVEKPERVRALIIFNGIVGRRDQALSDLLQANWDLFVTLMAQIVASTDNLDRTLQIANTMKASVSHEQALAHERELATIDVRPLLGQVTAPTLLQARREPGPGDFPFASHSRELASMMPTSELRLLPGNSFMPDRAWLESTIEFIEQLDPEPASRAAPSISREFRTIFFSDVVASTPLLLQLRDEKMREVMRAHDAVMTAVVSGHGGRVVKTIGDAFMAEFAVPSAAVAAAVEAQRAIRDRFSAGDVPVQLRIGINAGEPIEEEGDLHGASVVIAKRLESAAETSGILVSDVVKQAVVGKEFTFEDRGPFELKGFEEPVRAWVVRWE